MSYQREKSDLFNEWLSVNSSDQNLTQETIRDISEAAYTASELYLIVDGVSLSVQDIILCWRIVEAIKSTGFPEELCM